MGSIISSFVSGFTKVIGDLFGTPLDFLAGKSCSSVCGSTWDFICYIENFCVANLLKMAMVLALFYIVLLFLYLLHKLGICQCVGYSLCKMVWACLVSWFSMWEYCCIFLCDKLIPLKRIRHDSRRDFEEFDTSEDEYDDMPTKMEVSRSVSRRMKNYRGAYLRKSLRPRSHQIRVGLRTGSEYGRGNRVSTVHSIRVTRTSKFARKGTSFSRQVCRRRRW